MSRSTPRASRQSVQEAVETALQQAGVATDDVAFDGLENEPPYLFTPSQAPAGAKVGVLDMTEIALALLLQLSGGSIQGKGVLRRLPMRPEFYDILSDEAQRFMVQQTQKAPDK